MADEEGEKDDRFLEMSRRVRVSFLEKLEERYA